MPKNSPDPSLFEGDESILATINKMHIQGEELEKLAAETESFDREADKAAYLASVNLHILKDADRMLSGYFRIRALARVVSEEPLPGWVKRRNGQTVLHPALYEAAAHLPLYIKEGAFVFSVKALLRKTIQLAKARRS